jgi:hypothetical protein
VHTAELATKDAEIVTVTAKLASAKEIFDLKLEKLTSDAELECNAAVMKEKIIQLQGSKQPRWFFDANRSVLK